MTQPRHPSGGATTTTTTGEPSSVVALRWQARALAALPAEHTPPTPTPSPPRWLAGTAAAREENDLSVVEYDPLRREARSASRWVHPAEVWAVAPHPTEASGDAGLLVATAWQAAPTAQQCRPAAAGSGNDHNDARAARSGWGATVWRAPCGGAKTAALVRACDLEEEQQAGAERTAAAAVPVRTVAWWSSTPDEAGGSGAQDALLTASADGALRVWRIGDGGAARMEASFGQVGGAEAELWAAEPHPTRPGVVAAATSAGAVVYDARQAATSGGLVGSFGCRRGEGAGGPESSTRCGSCGLARWRAGARCVSWAPPGAQAGGWRLASAGDDGRLRFWDLRTLSSSSSSSSCPAPLLTLGGGHGHAVSHLAHHPQHDSLLASAGSDGGCVLWHTPRLAAGGGGVAPAAGASAEQDGKVWAFDDPACGGDDALRGVAWAGGAGAGGGGGVGDAWALAALAHDGRVAVHHVPRAVRYAVLV
jgi:hypothetical protein